MNKFWIFTILLIVGGIQVSNAQNNELEMELEVTDEEKIMLFTGFSIAILGIVLFLARDIILRRKTSYDKNELESKKDKTFEKYHSDWSDDYEEFGNRYNSKDDKEFRNASINNELPNYYEVLGITKDATPDQIKQKFRQLAKKTHPDKTKEDSEEEMIELNEAYEVLSDKERREKYDRYFKVC